MAARCKKCGSEDSLMRFRMPDEDEPPVATWKMECTACGEMVEGIFSGGENGVDEEVGRRVAEKFWI